MSEERNIIDRCQRKDIPEHPISKLFRLFLFQQRKREKKVVHNVNKEESSAK